MTAHQSPFVSDFLTGDSAHTYREAVALAAEQASVTLGGATAPGLVDGYSALKRDAERLDLDDPDGVGAEPGTGRGDGVARREVGGGNPSRIPGAPTLPTRVAVAGRRGADQCVQPVDGLV